MLALAVVPPEVVRGVGHLAPEHGRQVAHLHVRLHLGRLQRVDVHLEVGVREAAEVRLQLGQALLHGGVDCAGRELGLHGDAQPRVAVQLADVAADPVSEDDDVAQLGDDPLPDQVGEHLQQAGALQRGAVQLQEDDEHAHGVLLVQDHHRVGAQRQQQLRVLLLHLLEPAQQ